MEEQTMSNHRYILFLMIQIFSCAAPAMEQAVKATSSPKSILKKTGSQSPETTKKSVLMLAEKLTPKDQPAKVKGGPFQQVNKNFDESIIGLQLIVNQFGELRKDYEKLHKEYQNACSHRDHLLDLNNDLSQHLSKRIAENGELRKSINQMQHELNLAKATKSPTAKNEDAHKKMPDGYCSE
jgi:hypothetical protein